MRNTVAVTLLAGAFAQGTYAGLIWFDENAASPGSLGELAASYNTFYPNPDQILNFNDLSAGDVLGEQYAPQGAHFTNTAVGGYAGYSRVQPEGGAIVEDLTGYDGSYMPNGDLVFVKFDNHLGATPLTIVLDQPASSVGAFFGMGVQGSVHTLRVSLFDLDDNLIGEKVFDSWLWEASSSGQNYEGFFGAHADGPGISRVELLNLSTANFANALVLDNLGFTPDAVPEPAVILLIVGGAVFTAAGWRR